MVVVVCFDADDIIHGFVLNRGWRGEDGTNYRWPECSAYGFSFVGSVIILRLNKLTVSDRDQVTLQLRVFPIWCIDF